MDRLQPSLYWHLNDDHALTGYFIAGITDSGGIGINMETGIEFPIYDPTCSSGKSALKHHGFNMYDVVFGMEPVTVQSPLADCIVGLPKETSQAQEMMNFIIGNNVNWLRLGIHKDWIASLPMDDKLKAYIRINIVPILCDAEPGSASENLWHETKAIHEKLIDEAKVHILNTLWMNEFHKLCEDGKMYLLEENNPNITSRAKYGAASRTKTINKCFRPMGENCPARLDPCCDDSEIPDPEKIHELTIVPLIKKRLGENQSYMNFNLYSNSMILQGGAKSFEIDDTVIKIMTPKEESRMAKSAPSTQSPDKAKVVLEDDDGRVVLYHKEWRSTVSKMYEDPWTSPENFQAYDVTNMILDPPGVPSMQLTQKSFPLALVFRERSDRSGGMENFMEDDVKLRRITGKQLIAKLMFADTEGCGTVTGAAARPSADLIANADLTAVDEIIRNPVPVTALQQTSIEKKKAAITNAYSLTGGVMQRKLDASIPRHSGCTTLVCTDSIRPVHYAFWCPR